MKKNSIETAPETMRHGSSSSDPKTPPFLDDKLLDQVATGLLFGLRMHGGNILMVNKGEVIAGSSIQEATIDYYYSSPSIILRDVENTLSRYISIIVKAINCYERQPKLHLVVYFLLDRLAEKREALHILALTQNILFWQKQLSFLPEQFADSWKDLPENHYDFLYDSFCFLFMEVIRKWSTADFNPAYLEICTKLIETPLTTTEIYSKTMAECYFEECASSKTNQNQKTKNSES
ncbi:MAG: hypothetical protein IKB97_06590 [Bacteroidaceae bacterium]|nr:hypothetical protein [Bacteroidaceae bacterium]